MPDVTHSNGPIIELQWLAVRCTQELDPLSRHLGRHPDTRTDLEATALIPARLLPTHGGTAVAALLRLPVYEAIRGSCSVHAATAQAGLGQRHRCLSHTSRVGRPNTVDQ